VQECGRLGAPIMTARIPLARVPERFALYEAGLAESGLDMASQARLRAQAGVWRFVHVAESQAQAEDELVGALLETRRHMVHARQTYNPADFHVESSRVNPWNDPRVSHEDGVRYSLDSAALYGTARRVADGIAEMREAGVQHVLCQMSYGFLPHATIMESMRRFGADVIPKFR
jgi:alkanesulfonate monooxygenase SsuD/methylene tetrahydromethanopterin reductase-like flavin-dependent oxidoreductase (luciferase family)